MRLPRFCVLIAVVLPGHLALQWSGSAAARSLGPLQQFAPKLVELTAPK